MTVNELPTPVQAPTPAPRKPVGQRADIQALRALAVGAVVVYHLLPKRVTGGFVGVDVFFVVSGFLIGSHLLKESVTTGRVRLGRFWARRARRLLPAALLVLVVVAVVTPLLVPLGQRTDVWQQIVGSAFYVQNWVLAAASVDYLASDDAASPLQHFWTLSVEEQFYVLLPLILVLVVWKARRRLLVATGVVGLLTVASVVWSVHLTEEVPPAAYFSTFTRAWEFLLGTLLAAAVVGGLRLHRYVRFGLGTVGVVLIVLAVVRYTGDTPFPGLAAALPVVGAMAVIAADGEGPLALASRLRPVTWLGDHSYALYLWHWPLIVLVPAATGHVLTLAEGSGVLVASLLISYASTRLLEDPLRYSAWLAPSGRAGVVSAVAMTVVAGLALTGLSGTSSHIDRLEAQASDAVVHHPRCLGARGECRQAQQALVPDPDIAGLDDWNPDACWGSDDGDVHMCHFGPRTGRRVLAIGDSHSNQYLAFYEHLANSRGWSVDVAGHAGCRWGTAPQRNTTPRNVQLCSAWKRNIDEMLDDHDPYDVIITSALRAGAQVARKKGESAYAAGVADASSTWSRQIARGSVVVALQDSPRPRPDIVDCVLTAAHVRSDAGTINSRCSKSRAAAYHDAKDILPGAVAATPGSALLDVGDLLCDEKTCPAVIGDVVVYRDKDHLTRTFVKTMMPQLGVRLDHAISRAEHTAVTHSPA